VKLCKLQTAVFSVGFELIASAVLSRVIFQAALLRHALWQCQDQFTLNNRCSGSKPSSKRNSSQLAAAEVFEVMIGQPATRTRFLLLLLLLLRPA
jgi:hypothetical protein